MTCVHRGEPTGAFGRSRECGSMDRQVPIFACQIYGECTANIFVAGKKFCNDCDDNTALRRPVIESLPNTE